MADMNISVVDKVEPVTPMQEINKAYEVCKFGKFHIKLLVITFFGCIASVLVTVSSSYILPIAECDLNMNLKQKGLLNAMPYFGMFVSTIIAGFLIDTFGRIYFLRIGFGGIFLCTLLSASSQTYEMLAAAKLCEGILVSMTIYTVSAQNSATSLALSVASISSCGVHLYATRTRTGQAGHDIKGAIVCGTAPHLYSRFATSTAAISALTSEFCHTTVRDRVMLCQSSYATLAQILSPAMAWGILIQDWRYSFFNGRFVLNIWNFYFLVMSLWSLTAFLLYLIIPESPKFLVTQKRYTEARNILIKIYSENSGKPAETFPYPNIFEKQIKEADSQIADGKTKDKFGDKILTGLKNMKPLLGRPLFGYIALIGLTQFLTMGIHNVGKFWFPQLSTIVEHFNLDGNQNLCDSLDVYTSSLKIKSVSNSTSEVCVPRVSGSETYINSMIIGLIGVLPYFISGVIVNKVGKKVLLFVGGLLTTASLLGLRWSNSKSMMVVFFSVKIAVTQTMKSLSQVVLIDVIPTAMRALALSVVMLIARLGTLVSNVAFPILLAMGCSIPFYTMAAMMSFVVVLTIFLPKKKQ